MSTISGNIKKTYAKSFFMRFNLKSYFADGVLSSEPFITGGDGKRVKVQVIQMMMCGDMDVIAEIILQNDYDELFKPKE